MPGGYHPRQKMAGTIGKKGLICLEEIGEKIKVQCPFCNKVYIIQRGKFNTNTSCGCVNLTNRKNYEGTILGDFKLVKRLRHKPYGDRGNGVPRFSNVYLCRCNKCGTEFEREYNGFLPNSKTFHCQACVRNNHLKKFLHKRYGTFTVIDVIFIPGSNGYKMKCQCDCGKIVTRNIYCIQRRNSARIMCDPDCSAKKEMRKKNLLNKAIEKHGDKIGKTIRCRKIIDINIKKTIFKGREIFNPHYIVKCILCNKIKEKNIADKMCMSVLCQCQHLKDQSLDITKEFKQALLEKKLKRF